MATIIWTAPALSNLDEIADYIALDNLPAAKKLVRRIFSDIQRLEQFPESGRIPAELTDSLYREVVVEPCRIFYRNDKADNTVYILHVMRSERQLRKYLIAERLNDES
ncbi:MAG: type II toxin-antitoxin system RelE/ParE family toxin [Gallionellaceae bacterium]